MYDEPEWDRVGVRAHEKSAHKPDDVTALLADVLAFLGGIRGDSPRGRLAARVEAALACSSEPISAGSRSNNSSGTDRDAVIEEAIGEVENVFLAMACTDVDLMRFIREHLRALKSPPTVG